MQNTFTIVVAWRESILVPAQNIWASDLGMRPKMKEQVVAKALVWLLAGSAADEAKAQAYAQREGAAVFCYPTSEKDPLGQAKRQVLESMAA